MGDYYVHETAIIGENVSIGDGTKIWMNSQIRENVRIGRNCIISKDTYLDHGVCIGDRTKIQNGVSIYHGVEVEDEVFIGPNVAFTNDMYPRAANEEWEVTKTYIKKGASIGANATIRCGITLGKYSMVGAGSVVTNDVPPYALVVGNPAKRVGTVCKCGAKITKGMTCSRCGSKLDEKE